MAFVIGLISTDRNLSKDEYYVSFTSMDLSLVEIFKKCLKLRVAIEKRARGYEQEKNIFTSSLETFYSIGG